MEGHQGLVESLSCGGGGHGARYVEKTNYPRAPNVCIGPETALNLKGQSRGKDQENFIRNL